MFGQKSTRQIDLHLPAGWNRCTTDELEAIAAAIIQEQQRVDRYHPFDWSRVKLNVVLAVNHIEVVRADLQSDRSEYKDLQSDKRIINAYTPSDGIANPAERHSAERHPAEQEEWLVRRPQDKDPWAISTGHLLALTDMLAWVDDEKSSKVIFQFPYPEMTLDVSGKTADHSDGGKERGSKFFTLHSIPDRWSPTRSLSLFTLQGPPPLLDGYTWQEYRWLTDWMQEYMRLSNALLQVKSEEQIVKNREAMENARNEFLTILFKPAGKPTDVSGKTADHSDGGSKFFTLHSSLFTSFDPVKWQVILFWWSSLMLQLQRKFPKVFKQQPVGKGKRRQQQDTPWDFYNRVTATIQKYIGGLSEQDVNNATYGTILQQLEMMADEAAEMEKIKNKK